MVQKIWYYVYELKPINPMANPRSGALLKVEFTDGKTGHADLHPYMDKGEASLPYYLKQLAKPGQYFPTESQSKRGQTHKCSHLAQNQKDPLCLRAIAIAREEAKALAQNRPLLTPCYPLPLSHYLITDLNGFTYKKMDKLLSQGFCVFKVKLRKPLSEQTGKLWNLMQASGPAIKWRVDFYQSLSLKKWQAWQRQNRFQIIKKNLDFIEAPLAYRERSPLVTKLAWDVWSGPVTLPVYAAVCKVSRSNSEELLKKSFLFKRIIFTHTLAHPLDQIASAYFAGRFYKVQPRLKEVCGLVQKDVYKKTAWTLPDKGPVFPSLNGAGWGFAHLLNKLNSKACH